jgi:PEP-CTERM motif
MAGVLRALGVIVAGLLITSFSSVGAVAGLVTVDFSGTVTKVDTSKIPGTKVGDSFSGTLVYDSDTPVTTPGTNLARYTASQPLPAGVGITLTVGGIMYAAESTHVMQLTVANDGPAPFPDAFTAFASVNVGGVATSATFGVGDSTGTAFSSTALPTSLDLSKFTTGEFVLGSTDSPILEGTINLQSVPEPGSAVLLGIGVLGGGCLLRSRRVRARRSAAE